MLNNLIALHAELNAMMKSTFDSIDTDSSGFIDMNELTNVAKALGHELAEEELKLVFDELDKNGDQKISFEEF
jgi:Ca2+-binding EF-hand superfamily protein